MLDQIISEDESVLTKDEQIMKMIDDSDFSRSEVLITLQVSKVTVTRRSKLQTEDYAKIMLALKSGQTNKSLSIKYKVTASRISEIKSEKSIPKDALRSYLEAKYS